MIGFPLGLLAANAGEWVFHKRVLHGRGRDPKSFWAFHLHEHHVAALRNQGADPDYARPPLGRHAQGKELAALSLTIVPIALVAPVAPFFAAGLAYSAVRYYRLHKRAHLDPAWARAHLPWHYDHHMGPDQEANWCVSRPWFDVVMRTRKPYVGTEREARDDARRARLAAERGGGA